MPGRLTSPAPRMTSPQHHHSRMGGPPIQGGRILTSPINSHAYAQQNIVQTQIVNQHRFVRPQQQQVNTAYQLYKNILLVSFRKLLFTTKKCL